MDLTRRSMLRATVAMMLLPITRVWGLTRCVRPKTMKIRMDVGGTRITVFAWPREARNDRVKREDIRALGETACDDRTARGMSP
jgi:hypothetical protein